MLVELAKVARALQDIRTPGPNVRARVVQLQATLRSFLQHDVIPVSRRYTAAWSACQKNARSMLGVRHLAGASKPLHEPIFANFPSFP